MIIIQQKLPTNNTLHTGLDTKLDIGLLFMQMPHLPPQHTLFLSLITRHPQFLRSFVTIRKTEQQSHVLQNDYLSTRVASQHFTSHWTTLNKDVVLTTCHIFHHKPLHVILIMQHSVTVSSLVIIENSEQQCQSQQLVDV